MAHIAYQFHYKKSKEKSIASLADKMGIELKTSCGGKGKCGKCKVQIVSGDVNKPTKTEEKHLKSKELDKGIRLACCTIPKGDVVFGPVED